MKEMLGTVDEVRRQAQAEYMADLEGRTSEIDDDDMKVLDKLLSDKPGMASDNADLDDKDMKLLDKMLNNKPGMASEEE